MYVRHSADLLLMPFDSVHFMSILGIAFFLGVGALAKIQKKWKRDEVPVNKKYSATSKQLILRDSDKTDGVEIGHKELVNGW